MAKTSDLNYMSDSAEYSVESIDDVGSGVPLDCPADLIGDPKEIFEQLAEEGKDRYRLEDLEPLVELAKMTSLLRNFDSTILRLSVQADNSKSYDKAVERADKIRKSVRILRDKLGATPPARFSVASRRRGSEHYTRNGAARKVSAARAQAVAALEASDGGKA